MRKRYLSVLVFVVLLSACGGAGSGGTITPKSSAPGTPVPAVAGTEEPKQYNSGKTPAPSSSDGYYGY